MMSGLSRARRGFAAAIVVAVVASALVASTASASPVSAHVRVEGAAATLYSGPVSGGAVTITDSADATHSADGSALWALALASRSTALPCVFTNSSWGLFVDSIAGESMVPSPPYPGWLYRVNGVSPMVGASDYALTEGDEVLWYYGTYDSSPTAVVVPETRIAVGTQVRIVVTQLDPAGTASPLAGATVNVGDRTFTSDASGAVLYTPATAGDYGVRASKSGYIRSALGVVRARQSVRIDHTSATSKVTRGSRATISARLTAGSSAVAGRTLVLQRRIGKGAWKRLASAMTGESGVASVSVRASASAHYRFVFAGDDACLGTIGPAVFVRVR